MDCHLEEIFVTEVIIKCEFALIASQRVNFLIKELEEGKMRKEGRDQRTFIVQLFESLAAHLQHVTTVSLIFFGDNHVRCKHLRALLGVNPGDVIEKRVFRNHFAHSDERLDKWYAKKPPFAHIYMNLGPLPKSEGLSAEGIFHNFDPATKEIFFASDVYKMADVDAYLQNLLDRAKATAATYR